MRDIVKIETERLVLRPLVVSDGARVARFTSDLDVSRMMTSIPHPYIRIAAEGWILIGRARAHLERDYTFGVELAGEGLIGCVGAHRRKGEAVEIGYWLGKPFWGQGFATEAVGAFVFEAQRLGPLEAGHFVDNPASGRVLEKAGFSYTGETVPTYSLARAKRAACRRLRHESSFARWQEEARACA